MKEKNSKIYSIILTVILLSYLIFNGILLAGHDLCRD